MSLFITVLIIYGLGLHPLLYVLATIVWLLHVLALGVLLLSYILSFTRGALRLIGEELVVTNTVADGQVVSN